MKKTISIVLASSISMFLCVAMTYAASIEPKVQKVAPTPPPVQPSKNIVKSIGQPGLPAAKVPKPNIKPGAVPKSSPPPKVKISKPSMPAVRAPTAPVKAAIPKSPVDSRQLDRIQGIRDAAVIGAELEQLKNLQNLRELPEQIRESGIDDRLGGGISPGERANADKFVREAFVGRGPTFQETDDMVNSWHDGRSPPTRQYGVGSAPGSDLVRNPGNASETTRNYDSKGNLVSVTTRLTERSKNGDTTTTETTQHVSGEAETSMTIKNSSGDTIYADHTRYDAAGNEISDYVAKRLSSVGGGSDYINSSNRRGAPGYNYNTYNPDSQPNEDGPSKYGNCNPVSGWGCKKKRDNPMDMVTQPATGESDTGRGSSAPNVGPVAVTNPGDNPNVGGGVRGRGTGIWGIAVDPEEIIPGAGGTGSGATSSEASDESMDDALGALR